MLKIFIILALFNLILSAPDDGCTEEQREEFKVYKTNFKKTYNSQTVEDQARKCYCKVDNKIKEHNANNKDYQQGHNKDSDGCNKVGSAYKTGYIPTKKVGAGIDNELPSNNRKVGAAPGSTKINGGIDYKNFTSAVKNQGSCGCCWASSAASVLSYHNAMYGSKNVVEFSDQYFVDCTKDAKGCGGGNPLNAFAQGMKGIPIEDDYKFQEVKGTCKSFNSAYKCKAPAYGCPYGNEATLQNLLENYGPGVVLINTISCPSLMMYSSGIFYDRNCANLKQIDHAVTLVGHGVDPNSKQAYWILKNSWGTEWGEDGYFRIRRGSNQMNLAYCYFIPCPPQLSKCK